MFFSPWQDVIWHNFAGDTAQRFSKGIYNFLLRQGVISGFLPTCGHVLYFPNNHHVKCHNKTRHKWCSCNFIIKYLYSGFHLILKLMESVLVFLKTSHHLISTWVAWILTFCPNKIISIWTQSHVKRCQTWTPKVHHSQLTWKITNKSLTALQTWNAWTLMIKYYINPVILLWRF